MNKTILIVEDMQDLREDLRKIIEQNLPDYTLVGEADSVETGYQKIIELQPEIVLFDIEIKNGYSFDILNKLKNEDKINFKFIFITAFGNADYALKAIKYSCSDFLVKPVTSTELVSALKAIESKIENQQKVALELALTIIQDQEFSEPFVGVNSLKSEIHKVRIKDIMYLKSETEITVFHLVGNSKIIGNKNIGYYANDYCSDFGFIKTHQSYVVNPEHIKSFGLAKMKLLLKSGDEIPVSKSGAKVVKNYLKHNDLNNNTGGIIKGIFRRLGF